jgi:hypothetical protein
MRGSELKCSWVECNEDLNNMVSNILEDIYHMRFGA